MIESFALINNDTTMSSIRQHLDRIDKMLSDIQSALKSHENRPIFVREGGKIISLNKKDILFLEGYGDYVKIHRNNGKPLLSQISLKRFEDYFHDEDFCRVHRSYIVSISHINSIEKKRIKINETLIPISDSYLPLLMNRLYLED